MIQGVLKGRKGDPEFQSWRRCRSTFPRPGCNNRQPQTARGPPFLTHIVYWLQLVWSWGVWRSFLLFSLLTLALWLHSQCPPPIPVSRWEEGAAPIIVSWPKVTKTVSEPHDDSQSFCSVVAVHIPFAHIPLARASQAQHQRKH